MAQLRLAFTRTGHFKEGIPGQPRWTETLLLLYSVLVEELHDLLTDASGNVRVAFVESTTAGHPEGLWLNRLHCLGAANRR